MIIFNNVSKKYGSANQAIFNTSLKINDGELVFLAGSPGAGKTTFIKLIVGLDKPDQGQLNVKGRSLSALSYSGLALARREMGIIMDAFSLFPNLTLEENIELPLRITGITKKEREKKVQDIIEQFGLTQKRHFFGYELPYQEKKLCMTARALVTEPCLIIADEIFDSMLPENINIITQKIFDLLEKNATAVISLNQVEIINDLPKRKRLITFSNGKIIKDEILKDRAEQLEGILDNV
ncbi:ATP-binding cassette domain-containing protein [Candidatus Desantisbacteria bacterium]|nr:ATP-binding cassette domain-containing protein [Candidatus Desantisbacteria bacterium]